MAANPAGDARTSDTTGDAGGPAPVATARPASTMLVDGRVAPLAEVDGSTLEERILDATLICVARWGVAKTTLDDIARQAGCGRATVYRVIPGGKDALMVAAGERELLRFFVHLAHRLAAAPTLADRLAVGIAESVRVIAGHQALQHLMAHEPGLVLPYVSFDALDPLLEAAASFGVDVLGPFLDPDEARATGEWVARIVLSYGFEADDHLDLGDVEVASRFVHRYLPQPTPAGPPAHPPVAGRHLIQERTHVIN
jgi:AcrR family transcriptional regulator